MLKLLSAFGGDLGTSNKEGNTALHFAAQNGYANICKFLGQRGEWVSSPFQTRTVHRTEFPFFSGSMLANGDLSYPPTCKWGEGILFVRNAPYRWKKSSVFSVRRNFIQRPKKIFTAHSADIFSTTSTFVSRMCCDVEEPGGKDSSVIGESEQPQTGCEDV